MKRFVMAWLGLASFGPWMVSAEEAAPVRIMPLGDSITQGDATHNSYRRPLWQKLIDDGYRVDFVGSTPENRFGDPPDADFDPDHEGHWGWRADEILERIEPWARAAKPDIVLIHLGVNDLFQGATIPQVLTDLRGIIDALRSVNPKVVLLLAKLIPNTEGQDVRAFNDELGRLAGASQEDSPVLIVDLSSGFNAAADTYDGVHPNEAGEAKMAEAWYQALRKVLPSRASPGL
jgi:hypothetical protein